MGDAIVGSLAQVFFTTLRVFFWIGKFLFGVGLRQWRGRQGQYRPQQLDDTDLEGFGPESVVAIQVVVGKSAKWDPVAAVKFIGALMIEPMLSLQIVAEYDKIRWIIATWLDGGVEAITNAVKAYYPDAEIDLMPYEYAPRPEFFRRVQSLVQPAIFPAPGLLAEDIKKSDPLAPLTNVMATIQPGERVIFSVSTFGSHPEANTVGMRMITTSNVSGFEMLLDPVGGLFRTANGADKQYRFRADLSKLCEIKLSQPLIHSLVHFQVEAATADRVEALTQVVFPQVVNFAKEECNWLDAVDLAPIQRVASLQRAFETDVLGMISGYVAGEDDDWKPSLCVLCVPEIAALYHLPHEGIANLKIVWKDESIKDAPEVVLACKRGYLIGRNRDNQIFLPLEERTQHSIIIGKSGAGKSALNINMAQEDILAGRGLVIVDPHGNLVRHVLQYCIPTWRMQDVVLLEMGNRQFPAPFNPLRGLSGEDVEATVNHTMSVLLSLYGEMAHKQMSDTLYQGLLLISRLPNPTLIDLQLVYEDDEFRGRLRRDDDDFVIKNYWDRFARMSHAQRDLLTQPIMHRISPFFKNTKLRAMACHPDAFDLGELMAQNKIILVSMESDERSVPSEQREVLISLLVSNVFAAAMSGAIKEGPFNLYIDEAQHFVGSDIARVLSEARKYGLGITLSHQYLEQISGDVLKAVEGNVSSIIAFEVGKKDAQTIIPYMEPQFTVNDLINLPKYRAAVSLRYDGRRQPAFTIDTLAPNMDPLSGISPEAAEQRIRQMSVENYTPRTYSEVNDWLNKRYDNNNGATPVGEPDDFIERT